MNKKLNDELVARYAIFLAAQEMNVEIRDNKLTATEKSMVEKEVSCDPELSEYVNFLKTSYIELYQD